MASSTFHNPGGRLVLEEMLRTVTQIDDTDFGLTNDHLCIEYFIEVYNLEMN